MSYKSVTLNSGIGYRRRTGIPMGSDFQRQWTKKRLQAKKNLQKQKEGKYVVMKDIWSFFGVAHLIQKQRK